MPSIKVCTNNEKIVRENDNAVAVMRKCQVRVEKSFSFVSRNKHEKIFCRFNQNKSERKIQTSATISSCNGEHQASVAEVDLIKY